MTIFLTATQVRVSPKDVRKSGPGHVSELAASIASVNLNHPLKVLPLANPKGKITHEFIAGSRRFAAVRGLIKAKRLPKDFLLTCEEVSEAEAEEISDAEYMVRTPTVRCSDA